MTVPAPFDFRQPPPGELGRQASGWLSLAARRAQRANRKSPTRTEAGLPQMMLAVRRPRRRPELSTTSSWRSVAVWMNSTAAASLCWRLPV